mmetsp:Transcript_29071/g.68526  ORF Transcript_29071/g.68526 Transcript_29071/m.68526 type:complete len:216 (+) Transcript_29071:65-712(+)
MTESSCALMAPPNTPYSPLATDQARDQHSCIILSAWVFLSTDLSSSPTPSGSVCSVSRVVLHVAMFHQLALSRGGVVPDQPYGSSVNPWPSWRWSKASSCPIQTTAVSSSSHPFHPTTPTPPHPFNNRTGPCECLSTHYRSVERGEGRVVSWRDHAGFGWIVDGEGRKLFAHHSDVSETHVMSGYPSFKPGQNVAFQIHPDVKWKWRAAVITLKK